MQPSSPISAKLVKKCDVDIVQAEAAEAQLNGFLDHRAEKAQETRAGREHANTLEAHWRESERRHLERERQTHLWQRLRFHERQLASHRATFREIIRRHKAGLAECELALGIQTSNERKETA